MNNNLSENLRKIRKENNLSQEQLAEELGVSRQAISKWESATAYPEMDKIIQLCNKFNVSIDDLLNKDIKEVKSEEVAKNNLNKYIDDFLGFITKTINMFSSMTFKSKMKCLFEQVVIGTVLLVISLVLHAIFENAISGLFWSILPIKVYSIISSILNSLFLLFLSIASIIIIIHIFKTRYLDYYEEIEIRKEKNIEKEKVEDKKIEDKKEDKIIIRDPKHSEYKFMNGLFKAIVFMIKFFALCFALFICFLLVMLFIGLVLSFLISKTGLLFMGVIIAIISASIVTVIIILLLFNFIFNRKNDKKKMIWSFMISVIAMGIGCGLIFTGILDFKVSKELNPKYIKTDSVEVEMQDDLYLEIANMYDINGIEYIESDINNIKIEFKTNSICNPEYHIIEDGGLIVSSYYENEMEFIKQFVEDFNNKIIRINEYSMYEVKIYASKENIEKLKQNYERQINDDLYYQQMIKDYENRINELEEELQIYKNN